MDPELLLVLKVNTYLDSIENKLGPKFYNVYYTASFAFKLYLEDKRRKERRFGQRVRNFFLSMYFRFYLFMIKFYDWKQSLFANNLGN